MIEPLEQSLHAVQWALDSAQQHDLEVEVIT